MMKSQMMIFVSKHHLDEVRGVVSVEGVFGQLVSVGHPGVSEDLTGRQPLVGINVQHLRHQVLRIQRSKVRP